jgi:phage shock protein PspC (stress-responsive transcriptional regulator)
MSEVDMMTNISARLANADKILCGVASGMAYQFDWSTKWTRVAWIVGTLINPGLSLLLYFALALLVKRWERRC